MGAGDRPAGRRTGPAARPAPAPDAGAAAARRISVTEVDRLKADPYAFYARKMLALMALDPVDADPTAAWRGSAVHAGARSLDEGGRLRPGEAARARRGAARRAGRASADARALAAAADRGDRLHRRPGRGEPRRGPAAAGGRDLGRDRARRGRAWRQGRPDRPAWPTAASPSSTTRPAARRAARRSREGYSLQLGLLGLIAERGGFEGIEGAAACFEYWSLARDAAHGPARLCEEPGRRPRAASTRRISPRWPRAISSPPAAKWLTGAEPFTAKLHPEYAPYGDYDQLMRLDEWYGRED